MTRPYVRILQKLAASENSCGLSYLWDNTLKSHSDQEPVLASTQNFLSLVTYKLNLLLASLVRDFLDSVVFLFKTVHTLFFLLFKFNFYYFSKMIPLNLDLIEMYLKPDLAEDSFTVILIREKVTITNTRQKSWY